MQTPGRATTSEITAPVTLGWGDAWLLPILDGAQLLKPGDLSRLRATAASSLWEACLLAGVVGDEAIVRAVAQRFRLPVADLDQLAANAPSSYLPGELAVRLGAVAMGADGPSLDVACANPTDMALEQAVAFGAGRRVRLHIASPRVIARALARAYPGIAPACREAPASSRLPSRAFVPPVPQPAAAPAAPAAPAPPPQRPDYSEFNTFVSELVSECADHLDDPEATPAPLVAPVTQRAAVQREPVPVETWVRGRGQRVLPGPRGADRPPGTYRSRP